MLRQHVLLSCKENSSLFRGKSKSCPCCERALHRIGEDVAERFDVVPTTFLVLVTRRPCYGCRSCDSGVVQALAPARIVEGSDNWTVIAMLIEICRLGGLNPHTWLTEALVKLANGHPANSVGKIMPWTAVA